MFCEKCGAKLEDDALFCTKCGAKVGASESTKQEKVEDNEIRLKVKPTFKFWYMMFPTVCVFLMIPINLSKKNRMYKIMGLFFKYILKNITKNMQMDIQLIMKIN